VWLQPVLRVHLQPEVLYGAFGTPREYLHMYSPINNARLVQDEVQTFQMLISDEMTEEFVRYTNIYTANVQSKYQTETDAKKRWCIKYTARILMR
jgi:hypothetical protein